MMHKVNLKQLIITVILAFSVALISIFSIADVSANQIITTDSGEKIEQVSTDVSDISNISDILNHLNLSNADIVSRYQITNETTSIVNIHQQNSSKYYNLYVQNGKVVFMSIQDRLYDGSTTFSLYEVDTENYFNSTLYLKADSSGNLIQNIQDRDINKAAFKWACIFSSYVACASVAAAAGAAGAIVSGPFGAAAGFTGGFACRTLFQWAVTKYGSKDKACSILAH